jgi:hypothetical protein
MPHGQAVKGHFRNCHAYSTANEQKKQSEQLQQEDRTTRTLTEEALPLRKGENTSRKVWRAARLGKNLMFLMK